MTGRIFGIRLMAALSALFNALALNLAMIVASLPLVTAPTAVSAASAALDRWARDGEDRVVRQFLASSGRAGPRGSCSAWAARSAPWCSAG
jgi:hypothetical protein